MSSWPKKQVKATNNGYFIHHTDGLLLLYLWIYLGWCVAGFSRCRVSAPSAILRDGRRGVTPSARQRRYVIIATGESNT